MCHLIVEKEMRLELSKYSALVHPPKKKVSSISIPRARRVGLAIQQSVVEVQNTEPFVGLTAIKEERLPDDKIGSPYNQ